MFIQLKINHMNTLIKLEEAALLNGLKYTDHFRHTHLGWIGQK